MGNPIKRRGNAAITAVSMTALLGFGALVVDIGMIQVTNAELQAAVDAGALGGAGYLDRTVPGIYAAQSKAVEIANLNKVSGSWQLSIDNVEIGIYDPDTDEFTVVPPASFTTVDPTLVNAVRIASSVSNLQAIFGNAAFQKSNFSTSAQSMSFRMPADGPAGEMDCLLPFAVPDCEFLDWIDGGNTVNPPPYEFIMTDSNSDNVGWGNPFSTPNTQEIKDAIDGTGCNNGTTVKVDDELNLGNGENASAIRYIGDVLNSKGNVAPTVWPDDLLPPGVPMPRGGPHANPANGKNASDVSFYGNVIQGPVALIEANNCGANYQFNGTAPITGFAYAYVYDVRSKGSSKNIRIQLDFINEYDIGGNADPDAIGTVVGFGPPLLNAE